MLLIVYQPHQVGIIIPILQTGNLSDKEIK